MSLFFRAIYSNSESVDKRSIKFVTWYIYFTEFVYIYINVFFKHKSYLIHFPYYTWRNSKFVNIWKEINDAQNDIINTVTRKGYDICVSSVYRFITMIKLQK